MTTDVPFTPTVTVDLTGLVIASGGELRQPVAAAVSSTFTADHDAATLTDLAHLDASNLHFGGDFTANISWLSADNATSDEWVYLDLGRVHDRGNAYLELPRGRWGGLRN